MTPLRETVYLKSMSAYRVLLVDDSPQFLQSASSLLRSIHGVELVGTAGTLAEAVKQAERLAPDLILLDLILPDGNGIEAARQIRQNNPQASIVILSIYDMNDYREAADAVGVLDFIPKQELSETLILSWLNRSPKEKVRRRILVVDDSPTIRRMIITALKPLEADFEEASNGLEALEKMTLMSFDLVTLDINMPDMHGMEVLQFIRKVDRLKDLPVIMLTTRGDEESLQEAMSLGANRYLTKPFSSSSLLRTVEELWK